MITLQTQAKQQLDMLYGPIWSKIPRFALPVAATAILEQLFNASDIAVVGNSSPATPAPPPWRRWAPTAPSSASS